MAAPAAALMEMDELVEEFLLRLPPDDPASLVRAALVCKLWRRILAGRGFRRRFRDFHRMPVPVVVRAGLTPRPHPQRPSLGWQRDGRLGPHHGREAAAVLCASSWNSSCDHIDCDGRHFLVVFISSSPHHGVYSLCLLVGGWLLGADSLCCAAPC
ncbi:uncharacterized protein [Miscanthus floridulus]|uniref:uncharacterized protein n=1 Tax=Miscanthus floridulus TaxID=154761 RepID=UPI003457B009